MKFKKVISILLVTVMLIGVLPTVAYAANTTEFAGGSGTENNPYLISTKAHLNNVRKYRTSYFKLTNDIVFVDSDFAESGEFYNSGKGFAPIGTTIDDPFLGSFDGNGFAIKNIYININISSDSSTGVGLFGHNKGTIKNLGLVGGKVSAEITGGAMSLWIGGIVGHSYQGIVSNCYNTADVSASSLSTYGSVDVGGIVGDAVYGQITNCYNTADVSGLAEYYTAQASGIAGCSNKAVITNCYNTGDISVTAYSGGIAGGISGLDYDSTVTNCYNMGDLSITSTNSETDAGGIIGFKSGGTITNCYNTGAVSTSSSNDDASAGGIAGRNYKCTITGCYNIGTVSALSSSGTVYAGGVVGYKGSGTVTICYYLNTISKGIAFGTDSTIKIKTEQISQQSAYTGFDFYEAWEFDDNVLSSPILKALHYHEYDNDCDIYCNECGNERLPNPHKLNLYTISNDTKYPFSYDKGTGIYSSTNKAHSSTSTMTLTAKDNGTLKIKYCTSTESKCDEFVIKHNNNSIKRSGNTQWQSTTLSIAKGDKIYIKYCKDSSASGGADAVFFKLDGFILAESQEANCEKAVVCNMCGITVKEALGHVYDGDCDINCNTCSKIRTSTNKHTYDNACDGDCNVCGAMRTPSAHVYDNACDVFCNNCNFERAVQHNYIFNYDTDEHYDKCTKCDDIINRSAHTYDDDCDSTCNDCDFERTAPHSCNRRYDNFEHYDKCSACRIEINIEEHCFNNDCDTTCNGCDYTRNTSHSWGEYLYNDDATTEADGTETRTCFSCGETEIRTAEGTKLPYDPTYRPDSHMPFLTLNESGNGVVLDQNKSWATRVYWGNIGEEYVEYKWFDEDFRLLCGTDYFADYSPKAAETYNFTKPGWYRFVVKAIRTGTSAENYTYSELVYDFYYDGSVTPTVPTITELGNNQIKINTNGTSIKKFYYGNIGQTNTPYSWFNSFWGTALGTKTYTPVFDTRDGRIITLQTKGYYNIVIVDTNNTEYVYTTYADSDAPVIKKVDNTAVVDIDILKGNVGTTATISKLYYGYVGTEDKTIATYTELKANSTGFSAVTAVQGTTINLKNEGYYKFLAVINLSNGKTVEIVYTI